MNEISVTPAEENAPIQNAEIDPVKLEQAMRDIKSKQSLFLALLGGIAAMVVSAVIWALITYWTEYQIGFMAIGVGIAVGFAVRICGKGITPLFGVTGAVLALLGCVLGNILTAAIVISQIEDVAIPFVLLGLAASPDIVVEFLKETFSPIDILFYVLAVWEGYKFSIRELTEEEMASMHKGNLTVPNAY
jgi:hypothetical protein